MKSFEDLVEFERRYRPFFDGAISLGNFDGYYGSLNVLYYMIWRSWRYRLITMSFCFGDAEVDDCYLFQDFINERSIEIPAEKVDVIINRINVCIREDSWILHRGKKLGYKTLRPEAGGILVDRFLDYVERQLERQNLERGR